VDEGSVPFRHLPPLWIASDLTEGAAMRIQPIRSTPHKRRGAVAVESAFVVPIAIVLLLAIFAGALGFSTYQQVAEMAREGSRWASVRGSSFGQSTGGQTPTSTDLYNNVLQPRLVNMDTKYLTYSLVYDANSTVTVSVSYQMSLPIYGTMTFSSTSTSAVTW
jgi:Flp pilus assembly protein TadG